MMMAYVDPSVMSYTCQAIAGVVVTLGVIGGLLFRRARRMANKVLGRDENANKEVEEEIVRK